MPTIYSQMQSLEPGQLVELFIIDLSTYGGSNYYFTSSAKETSAIVFQGQTFTPIDFKAEGFETNGSGSLPTPKIQISNTTKAISEAVIAYNDLIGCKITRLRTFRNFLDGELNADPNAMLPADVFIIDRKSVHNKLYIEWELAAAMDQQGRMLPGRQVLRDTCTHRYRAWNPDTGDFDYSKVTCPYAGTGYFTFSGDSTFNPGEDICGKKFSDCKARFGNQDLPTRAFPGVARVRIT